MTAQIHDSFTYLSETYALVACSNGAPFSPTKAGYRPTFYHTADQKGYRCHYEVKDGKLHLQELLLHSPPGRPPDLNGVACLPDQESCFGYWHFHEIGLPLIHSGGLLLGRNFIEELYAHIGFHPMWKFRQVHELVFEEGQLVEARDASTDTEILRVKVQDTWTQYEIGGEPVCMRDRIKKLIVNCFKRDYSRNLA